ncbi:hypothetical protein R6Q59_023645 [Mikania micrantha]
MLRRTKNFFKKSIETFKSYFSEGYEKLPKTPSYNGFNHTYSEFVDEWEASDRVVTNSYENHSNNLKHEKLSMMISYHKVDHKVNQQKHEDISQREREEKRHLVTKRLKELAMLDENNVDHVLDIQEVLQIYSRLSCPTYCQIVENFFTQMYLDIFSSL